MTNFEKVKNYLLDLKHEIVQEHTEEQLYVITDSHKGICNMVLDCEDDILVMEQHLFDIDGSKPEVYKHLLQLNRTLVHGAIVLDETGTQVIFRDTLQLQTLDANELESSINALALALAENLNLFLSYAARKTEKVA